MTGESVETVTFSCEGCGRPFVVPANFAGRKATCKTCGAKVMVPTSRPQAEPAESTREERSAPSAQSLVESSPPGTTSDANGHLLGGDQGIEIPVIPAPARPTGGETAVSTSDPTQPQRRSPSIAMISEAQAPPVLGTTAPVAFDAPTMPAGSNDHPAAVQHAARPQAPGQAAPKMPVRIRRLLVDAEQMTKAFSNDGSIRIKSTVGEPPELYQIEYEVKGMQRGWLGRPSVRNTHTVEIQLTSEYPRISPKCKMLTPIFHPNIDETTICVGDHWTAGERLVDLTIRIGEMIAYQAYNIKSPLNGEAAMWADLNPKKLPVDPRNLRPGETEA